MHNDSGIVEDMNGPETTVCWGAILQRSRGWEGVPSQKSVCSVLRSAVKKQKAKVTTQRLTTTDSR